MIDKEILDLEIRRKIFDFINKHPGIHIRKISRTLEIPKSTLVYHLNYLEKNNLVSENSSKKYVRYYVCNKVGIDNKTVLNFLRSKTSRNIILHILFNVASSRTQISNSLNKHPTTVAFHLKKMQEEGIIKPVNVNNGEIYANNKKLIIERKLIGREIVFKLVDPKLIYDLFITNYDSLLDKNSKIIIDFIKKCDSPDPNKKYKNLDSTIDTMIDNYFELFPNPYCI